MIEIRHCKYRHLVRLTLDADTSAGRDLRVWNLEGADLRGRDVRGRRRV
jgi:hypothetical protein